MIRQVVGIVYCDTHICYGYTFQITLPKIMISQLHYIKTAFNTVYLVKIKDKMAVISDSLKPFTPTDNSLIISITHSHSFISSVLKTDNLTNFHFCYNPISETFPLAHICPTFRPSIHLQLS